MKKEYCLAGFTIFCWGTLPAVTKLSLTSIPNMQVLFISSLIAALCLFIYLFVSGRIKKILTLTCSDLLQLVGLGFLGNFLYSALYYESLRTLPSADACIINYLWPIVATVCACILLHEKIRSKEWLAIILSFVGVSIIATNGNGFNVADAKGVFLCISGAVCYGLFNVLNKKKGLDQLLCTAIYFAVTAICCVPILLITGDVSPVSGSTWLGLLWLGIIIDAMAILAWGTALLTSKVGFITNLAYLTPVIAMIISYITLGEPIEVYAIAGMIFVLSGCLIQVISLHKL